MVKYVQVWVPLKGELDVMGPMYGHKRWVRKVEQLLWIPLISMLNVQDIYLVGHTQTLNFFFMVNTRTFKLRM